MEEDDDSVAMISVAGSWRFDTAGSVVGSAVYGPRGDDSSRMSPTSEVSPSIENVSNSGLGEHHPQRVDGVPRPSPPNPTSMENVSNSGVGDDQLPVELSSPSVKPRPRRVDAVPRSSPPKPASGKNVNNSVMGDDQGPTRLSSTLGKHRPRRVQGLPQSSPPKPTRSALRPSRFTFSEKNRSTSDRFEPPDANACRETHIESVVISSWSETKRSSKEKHRCKSEAKPQKNPCKSHHGSPLSPWSEVHGSPLPSSSESDGSPLPSSSEPNGSHLPLSSHAADNPPKSPRSSRIASIEKDVSNRGKAGALRSGKYRSRSDRKSPLQCLPETKPSLGDHNSSFLCTLPENCVPIDNSILSPLSFSESCASDSGILSEGSHDRRFSALLSKMMGRTEKDDEGDKVKQPSHTEGTNSASRFKDIAKKFYRTHEFLILVAIAIILAKTYPEGGAIYLAPSITSSWIAVMITFREYRCCSIVLAYFPQIVRSNTLPAILCLIH
jgi:hypothetical protein